MERKTKKRLITVHEETPSSLLRTDRDSPSRSPSRDSPFRATPSESHSSRVIPRRVIPRSVIPRSASFRATPSESPSRDSSFRATPSESHFSRAIPSESHSRDSSFRAPPSDSSFRAIPRSDSHSSRGSPNVSTKRKRTETTKSKTRTRQRSATHVSDLKRPKRKFVATPEQLKVLKELRMQRGYHSIPAENQEVLLNYRTDTKVTLYRAMRPDEILNMYLHGGITSQCKLLTGRQNDECRERSLKTHIERGSATSSDWISATSELSIAAKWAASAEGAILSNTLLKNRLSGVIAVFDTDELDVVDTQHMGDYLDSTSNYDYAKKWARDSKEYLIYHFIPLRKIKLIQASIGRTNLKDEQLLKVLTYTTPEGKRIDIQITRPPLRISRTMTATYDRLMREIKHRKPHLSVPVVKLEDTNYNMDDLKTQYGQDISHRTLTPDTTNSDIATRVKKMRFIGEESIRDL